MSRDDQTRAAILRRRLLYVGQALALAGCASPTTSPAVGAPETTGEPSGAPSAEPSATASSAEPRGPGAAASGLASASVPPDARPEMRERYEARGDEITGTARYSHFRTFRVETSEIIK